MVGRLISNLPDFKVCLVLMSYRIMQKRIRSAVIFSRIKFVVEELRCMGKRRMTAIMHQRRKDKRLPYAL